ncbi:PhoU domain-containing protein [Lacticaseibacillus songhuajiangensis]|jgi:phosphate transport system protein|uniref:PhoU domain-containing protein n=1 Tax=Lacticaseibacillus songhuajiangensis TaxID=1296539 RepID=UPI000F772663|nr:PhoU domain-containing protein [Lacticaseibacillus songhuajiangensis]
MSTAVEEKLHRIDFMIAEMSLLAGGMVYDAASTVCTGDTMRADRVQHDEAQMNDALKRLEFLAMRTAALEVHAAPVQHHILRAAKTAANIELIADGASMIAQHVQPAHALTTDAAIRDSIIDAAYAVQTLLEQVTDAYVRGDQQVAQQLTAGDDRVDAAYARGRQLLSSSMQQHAELANGITCLLILQQLELMGDQVVDITRWIGYGREKQVTSADN